MGGALAYLVLRMFLSPAVTLYVQTAIPLVMVLTYVFVLGKPGKIVPSDRKNINDSLREEPPDMNGKPFEEAEPLIQEEVHVKDEKRKIRFFNPEELRYWLQHMKYIPRLWKYMLPLFVVYIAEYMINQSLFEQLYNPGTFVFGHWKCLDQATQYRV